jgi:hypothetical protein
VLSLRRSCLGGIYFRVPWGVAGFRSGSARVNTLDMPRMPWRWHPSSTVGETIGASARQGSGCGGAPLRPPGLRNPKMNLVSTVLLALAMSTGAFAAAVGKDTALEKPCLSETLRIAAILGVI